MPLFFKYLDINLNKIKKYYINIFDKHIIIKNISRKGTDYITKNIKNSWKKHYIINVNDKHIGIFGNIFSIKKIIRHEETETTNYMVKKNNNTYTPSEFAGIFIKFITAEQFNNLCNS